MRTLPYVALLSAVLLALTAVGASRSAAAPKIVFVDVDATGNENGTSWPDAYTNLAAALFFQPGPAEFWVAEGEYKPDWLFDNLPGSSFVVGDGQEVYAGFAGTETALDQRDPGAHFTILSGEMAGTPDPADDAYHVVTVNLSDTGAAVIDGFTIQQGYGDFPGDEDASGLMSAGGSLTLANSAFFGSPSGSLNGAAITLRDTDAAIKSVRISGSSRISNDIEGGIEAFDSDVVVQDAEFQRGKLTSGTSIYVDHGSVQILNSRVVTSGSRGIGLYVDHATNATIEGSEFLGLEVAAKFSYTSGSISDTLIKDAGRGLIAEGNAPAPVVDVTNTTFSEVGIGVFANSGNIDEAIVAVQYSTFTGFAAFAADQAPGEHVSVRHSIVSGMNAAPENKGIVFENDILTSGCPTGSSCLDIDTDDPRLRALDDNGGPTKTLGLAFGSPAIDAATGTTCPATDQRGQARPVDGDGANGKACDLGAFELNPPRFAFATGTGAVTESAGQVSIDVTLDQAVNQDLTIDYAATGGTAKGGGVDYSLEPGTLTLSQGTTSASIPLTITKDGISEGDETIVITLSNPGEAVLGKPRTHVLTILGAPPKIEFAAVTGPVAEGAAPATLRIQLDRPLSQPVTAKLQMTGNAKQGFDYRLSAERVRIPAHTRSVKLTFEPIDDFLVEPGETVRLTLTDPVNALLGSRKSVTVTIDDNEPRLRCDGRLATHVGTAAADTIIGTTGNDIVVAKGGADTVRTLGGNDVVCAGGGNDTVKTGAGKDATFGNGGNDILLLGGGVDRGFGNGGADEIHGGGGNDILGGGGGTDQVLGEAGRDRLSGGPGAGDRCDGGPATDSLAPLHGCEVVAGVP